MKTLILVSCPPLAWRRSIRRRSKSGSWWTTRENEFFQLGTVAIEANDEIWIGGIRGSYGIAPIPTLAQPGPTGGGATARPPRRPVKASGTPRRALVAARVPDRRWKAADVPRRSLVPADVPGGVPPARDAPAGRVHRRGPRTRRRPARRRVGRHEAFPWITGRCVLSPRQRAARAACRRQRAPAPIDPGARAWRTSSTRSTCGRCQWSRRPSSALLDLLHQHRVVELDLCDQKRRQRHGWRYRPVFGRGR